MLRGNTLSSKMMTKYVKLAGGTHYLQETFLPLVQKNLSATWVWEQQINQRPDSTPEEARKSTLRVFFCHATPCSRCM